MIEFHADDYGMFRKASSRIIECINKGCINGISLMANSRNLAECMKLLDAECVKRPEYSIHLNILTEKALSPKNEIPDIVDEKGIFNITYGKLILALLRPKMQMRLKAQIKKELTAQIDNCLPFFPEGKGIRLDSHRHFHMVPYIFDSIVEIIKERNLNVTYIRIISERSEFYRGIQRFEYFRLSNLAKAVLLNIFSVIDSLNHKALYEKMNRKLFASILFSGYMTRKNLRLILRNISTNPLFQGMDIELMIHPGAVLEKEDLLSLNDSEDQRYMSDPMRLLEEEAVLSQGIR